MKRHVLFVDDEPNVLDGLRRVLRPLRGEWDVWFAPGGPEALELLAARPTDVLVTDLRMPGMAGDELLAAARRLYPHTARFVLTGECKRESIQRLAGLAHRVLTKPCDPEELKLALTGAHPRPAGAAAPVTGEEHGPAGGTWLAALGMDDRLPLWARFRRHAAGRAE